MSQEEITKLEQEERELEEALRIKREARQTLILAEKKKVEEEQAQLEALKPLEIKVVRIQANSIVIHSKYREDLINIFKSTPGHAWNFYVSGTKIGINLIPMTSWLQWRERVEALENKDLIFNSPQLIDEINYQVNTPPWEIGVQDDFRRFTIKVGPGQYYNRLADISGIKWEDGYPIRNGTCPVSEGWRIPQLLEHVVGVIYSELASNLIFAQVESRAKLDKLASQKDSDDPRLDVLTRQVYARGKWDTFRNQMEGFQRVGVSFMLEANGRMLLSDSTGLGKTWQMIAYAEIMRAANPNFQTLFAVKASNLPNWKREILRLTGETPIVCYNGHWQNKILGDIYTQKPAYILIGHETLGTYVTLETPENLSKPEDEQEVVYFWAEVFSKLIIPNFLGLDEAHQIKNPSTHRSKAARKLGGIEHIIPATASPIKNRAGEFWAPLYLVNPWMFESHSKFLNDYTINGREARDVKKLQELLRPVFLRRTKAEVQAYLPPINRIQKIVEMDQKHKDRYDEVMQGLWKQLESFNPDGKEATDFTEVAGILATFTRLRQVCSHFKAQDYTPDLAQGLIDESESDSTKVLIFTQFKAIAYEIARRLGGEAICTVRKSGSNEEGEESTFESLNAEERDRLFESARHDKAIRFIVTTSAAKEGHNLEFCDWVIFNDQYWTPEDHIQCEGRAYGRLSDPHPIDSFYVIADEEMETIMQDLLEKKMEIIAEMVDGVEASRDITGSIMMELIKKMKESMWRKA